MCSDKAEEAQCARGRSSRDILYAGAQYTTKLRLSYVSHAKGDSVLYVDNIKIYNAAQPREVIKETPKAPQTFDAAVILAAVSVLSASGVIVSKKRK